MSKGKFLGEFEHLVSLAVLRLKSEAYGMRVRREIQSRTDRSVSIGSVYATLKRLEDKGLIRSTFGGSDQDGRGQPRKYFRLTPAGARALQRKHDSIRSMTEGISLERELEAL